MADMIKFNRGSFADVLAKATAVNNLNFINNGDTLTTSSEKPLARGSIMLGTTILGVSQAKNLETDSSHRFVSDSNITTWNNIFSFKTIETPSGTVIADNRADTLKLKNGNNISITASDTDDSITIANTYKYTHPSYKEYSPLKLWEFTTDSLGHINSASLASWESVKDQLAHNHNRITSNNSKYYVEMADSGYLIPSANNLYLGQSSTPWLQGYITTLNSTTINSTNISNSNLITTKYLNTTEIGTVKSLRVTSACTVPTISSKSDSSTNAASTAFVQGAIDLKLAANNAMQFKGTVSSEADLKSKVETGEKTGKYTYQAGYTFKVSASGWTFGGKKVEIGDMIIAIKDSQNEVYTQSDFDVIQANIDGAVTGPTSATDAHIAVFNGTTGKIIKDSGATIASIKNETKLADIEVSAVSSNKSVKLDFKNVNNNSLAKFNIKANGSPISVTAVQNGEIGANDDEVQISHNTVSQATATGSAINWSGSAITGLEFDGYGHVNKIIKGAIPAEPHDTKYDVIVGTDNSTTDTAVSTNGYVHLNVIEDGKLKHPHKISGSGITTVKSDASGNITINTPNTNTDTHWDSYIQAADNRIEHYENGSRDSYVSLKNSDSMITISTPTPGKTGAISIDANDSSEYKSSGTNLFNRAGAYNMYTELKNGYASSAGHSATTDKLNPVSFASGDLNTLINTNCTKVYYGGGSNTVKSKPEGVDAYGMLTLKSADGYTAQFLASANQNENFYWKMIQDSAVTSAKWRKILDEKNSSVTKSGETLTVTLGTWTGSLTNTNTHFTSKNIVGASKSAYENSNVTNPYINHIESNNNTPTSSHQIKGGGITTVKSDASGNITINTPNTNSHFTTGLYVNNDGATKANKSSANGNTYLTLFDDSAKRQAHKISGTGITKVTSDESGNIIIDTPNTNTWRGISDDYKASPGSSDVSISQKAAHNLYSMFEIHDLGQ